MRVSVLVPSAGRPDLLKDMLFTLQTSTNWARGEHDVEVVLVVDEDEKSLKVAERSFSFDGKILDWSPKKRGALWAWNRALQLSTGDILVPSGDDQTFHGNWLEYALESHQTKLRGYGVVGMNDLAYNGDLQVATMFLFDRKYCKEQMGGIFAPPMYRYYCIDLEWNEKAKVLGKFYWDSRSIVEHVHSAHGKRPIDDLDREKMDAGWMEEDNKTYQERKSQGFPVTWTPII